MVDDDGRPAGPFCDYCREGGRLKRCSKCRQAFYCSVQCQKEDWTDGNHRSKCKGSRQLQQQQAQQAWTELQDSLLGMSPKEAHIKMQKAQEQVRIHKVKVQDETVGRARIAPTVSPTAQDTQTSPPVDESVGVSTTTRSKRIESGDDWTYVIEEFSNLACYQITLRPPLNGTAADLSSSSEVQLSIKCTTDDNTIVRVQCDDIDVFCARIPRRLVSKTSHRSSRESSLHRDGDVLSLRLPCDSHPSLGNDDVIPTTHTTPLWSLNRLQCLSCRQSLFMSSDTIHRVLPLPAGHWDEVIDYLICYNGQPAVNFSSTATSAQPTVAMEDESVVVLHREHLEHSVCVLAIEAYGDDEQEERGDSEHIEARDSAAFRGPRGWRDSVGGATVCCSLCCGPLGCASVESPETFRLLKHRLAVTTNNGASPLQSCASFVAHEMVRYAESKAIYTFVVSMCTTRKKCLLLKLLNWDSIMALSRDAVRDSNGVDQLQFQRVAKVVYEVSHEPPVRHDLRDPMQWTWGGIDLCCVPGADRDAPTAEAPSIPKGSTASVQLFLPPDEWSELCSTLVEQAPPVSKAVVDATLLVKIGRKRASEDASVLGLSALHL